jgi:hypothetical protein
LGWVEFEDRPTAAHVDIKSAKVLQSNLLLAFHGLVNLFQASVKDGFDETFQLLGFFGNGLDSLFFVHDNINWKSLIIRYPYAFSNDSVSVWSLYLKRVRRSAFLTSLSPAFVACHSGKRTLRPMLSMSFDHPSRQQGEHLP